MLVLNLACEAGHGFEGWFGSAADFESQQSRGLLSCPLCNSTQVRRMPSAPRLNLSAAVAPVETIRAETSPGGEGGDRGERGADAGPGGAGGGSGPALPVELQRQVMQAMRQLIANTEDVGERFAEEARRIHYGETEARGIRGRTTPDEAHALAEEGIEVVALPVPDGLKDPLQ